MKLEGNVAIVTGGGRGIGKATALLLAETGCDIVITARTKKELEETAEEIEKKGREVLVVQGDIRDKNVVRNVVKKALEKFGRVDILINNAGVAYYKPLTQMSDEEINETYDVK